MTQLEQKTLSLLANACAKYISKDSPDNINWEQRKYETVKDYAIALMSSGWWDGNPQQAIECGIKFADNLIERLKQ